MRGRGSRTILLALATSLLLEGSRSLPVASVLHSPRSHRAIGRSQPALIRAVVEAPGEALSSKSSKSSKTDATPCGEWELDFYSRPVQGADGKKLWELLVTDTSGSFYHAEAVPSNCVNSRELRKRVQRLITEAEVPPTQIRFFRVQMKNMITIALRDLNGIRCTPSRVTYRLYDWIGRRNRDVYPTLPGYKAPRPEAPAVKLPVKLPDQLRGEQYAFVTLPYAEFLQGGAISEENIGFGSLCPVPDAAEAPAVDAMVSGLAIFSKRSGAIAAWLSGTDLCFVKAVIESRELMLEVGLDTQYLLARIRNADQQLESKLFEEGKARSAGLHFLSVQSGPDADEPDGFWLLRDFEAASGGKK